MFNAENLGKHRSASQTYTRKKTTCIPSSQAGGGRGKLKNVQFHTFPSGVVSKYMFIV